MNYDKFLNKSEEAVLLYLGGPSVLTKDRRLRVAAPRPALGAHRFAIAGRTARAVAPAEPVLDGLPRARGHFVAGFLVDGDLRRVRFLPEEELAPFSIVRARRWYSNDLVFEATDFDGDVETEARLALERRSPLAGKGISPSLRIAYGVALALALAARRNVPLSVREAAGFATKAADGGEPFVVLALDELVLRRAVEADRARIAAIVDGRRPSTTIVARAIASHRSTFLRAEDALEHAGARMLSGRRLANGLVEIAFDFMDERIVSVVDELTLQVHDAGVCLAGADDLVTLDSLPGVIREAIDTDRLVITRH